MFRLQNLNRARHHIDSALLMMKLNASQSFAQQKPAEVLTVTPLNRKRVAPNGGSTNQKLPSGKRAKGTGRGIFMPWGFFSVELISDEKLMKIDRKKFIPDSFEGSSLKLAGMFFFLSWKWLNSC